MNFNFRLDLRERPLLPRAFAIKSPEWWESHYRRTWPIFADKYNRGEMPETVAVTE